MSSEPCIVDTVVLLYFLLVEHDQLLRDLVGDPVTVPRAVYDPDDRSLPEEALRRSELLSEMRQCVRHYDVAVRTRGGRRELHDRVLRVDWLFDHGHLDVVDMTEQERLLAARLQSRDAVSVHRIRAPLGAGEAACVAIALERGWTIATDDDAAITVLDKLHGGQPYSYERIRKLLIRAANEKRLTRAEANEVHARMRRLGFWDSGTPFA